MTSETNTERTPNPVYVKWAIKEQTASAATNTLRVASAQLPLNHDLLDADPWLLNVKNGTIDLKTGILRPHSPEDFLTKISPVIYDQNARCELFMAFLERIFNHDHELIRFVQKAVGYSITGSVTEQAFFLCHGTGANGKSTFDEVISYTLGDYATTAAPGLLMTKKHEAHPTEMADLFRARFVKSSEVKAEAKWDEERIKMLTGGDKIKARRMREDFWEFEPTHKIWISVNHRPATTDNSVGFWRRVRLIPFTVTIPKSEQDPKLLEKLKCELPSILAWAVRGCLLWQQEGLEMPESVKEATEAYRHETDDLQAFLDERCDRHAGLEIQSITLYNAYRNWVIARGGNPVSHISFSGRLKGYGFQFKKSSATHILGLALIQVPSDLGGSNQHRGRTADAYQDN